MLCRSLAQHVTRCDQGRFQPLRCWPTVESVESTVDPSAGCCSLVVTPAPLDRVRQVTPLIQRICLPLSRLLTVQTGTSNQIRHKISSQTADHLDGGIAEGLAALHDHQEPFRQALAPGLVGCNTVSRLWAPQNGT